MLRMKKVTKDNIITDVLFRGFISAVERIKNNNKKNAAPATHAGTISIISPLKRIKLSATVVGENIARRILVALTVKGVRIL